MKSFGPTVTALRGDEIVVTELMRAQAFWLLRRYTSFAYIDRMCRLLSAFNQGYEEYARTDPPEGAAWFRENLLSLFTYQGKLEKGLGQIRQGYPAGYALVAAGAWFGNNLISPRDEYGKAHEVIGYRPPPAQSVGLFAWAERAISMCRNVRRSVEQNWTYAQLLAPELGVFRSPAQLEPLPKRTGVRVRYAKDVPVSGIWQPTDIPGGCPNYLWAGCEAPKAQRLAQRLDYPAMPAGKWTPAEPPRSAFEYAADPTAWELLWEDHRYEGGQKPDESEYLDETTELPPYPPRHEPG